MIENYDTSELATLTREFRHGYGYVNARLDSVDTRLAHHTTELKELRGEIKTQGEEIRAEMKAQGEELRAEMKTQGEELRAEMKTQGEELRAEMKAQGEELRAQIKVQGDDLLGTITGLFTSFERTYEQLREFIIERTPDYQPESGF